MRAGLQRWAEDRQISKDSQALLLLGALTQALPYGTSALRPSALVSVVNDIRLNARTSIVEFGAGVSTIVLARLEEREERGIHCVSYEESPSWATFVRRQLPLSVAERFHIVVAPLRSTHRRQVPTPGFKVQRWYSIPPGTLPESIDLALVDGPSAGAKARAYDREPALAHVLPYLTESAGILLDDTHRKGERRIADKWTSELSQSYRRIDSWSFTWWLGPDAWNPVT